MFKVKIRQWAALFGDIQVFEVGCKLGVVEGSSVDEPKHLEVYAISVTSASG